MSTSDIGDLDVDAAEQFVLTIAANELRGEQITARLADFAE
ncbi:MAG TPA: hypothetical protein VGC05_03465 [Mycobacterium sp.]